MKYSNLKIIRLVWLGTLLVQSSQPQGVGGQAIFPAKSWSASGGKVESVYPISDGLFHGTRVVRKSVDIDEIGDKRQIITTFKSKKGVLYRILKWKKGSNTIHFGAVHFDSIFLAEISLKSSKEEGKPASILVGTNPHLENKLYIDLYLELFRHFNKEARRFGITTIRTSLEEMSSSYTPYVLKDFLERMKEEGAITNLEFDSKIHPKYATFEIPSFEHAGR